MVQLVKSMVLYIDRETGNHVKDSEVTPYGYADADWFLDCISDDIDKMLENAEEPNDLNGQYETPNFTVLHTIVGNIDGIQNVGYGRNTYNFIDVGIPDKILVVMFMLDVVQDYDLDFIEYEKMDDCIFFLSKGAYTDYLMTLTRENNII